MIWCGEGEWRQLHNLKSKFNEKSIRKKVCQTFKLVSSNQFILLVNRMGSLNKRYFHYLQLWTSNYITISLANHSWLWKNDTFHIILFNYIILNTIHQYYCFLDFVFVIFQPHILFDDNPNFHIYDRSPFKLHNITEKIFSLEYFNYDSCLCKVVMLSSVHNSSVCVCESRSTKF